MLPGPHPLRVLWLAGSALVIFGACGGKSANEPGSANGKGGSSATGGTSNTGGKEAEGCTFNGVHYQQGQTFGACNECVCDSDGGVICKTTPGCVSGTGGVGNAAGGATGGSAICEFEGKLFVEGASWLVDCNTCYCKGSLVSCTEKACSSGTGGVASGGASPGSGGAAARGGAASAGQTGDGGMSSACEYAPIGAFCVQGKPSGDGQDLVEGMPLTISMRPAGCYSSSCTKLVSTACNYIGSDGVFWVSGFVCLARVGDICTDDCGGGGNPICEPGIELSAGDYTVGIGGTSLAVKFKVPSHVIGDELCASLSAP